MDDQRSVSMSICFVGILVSRSLRRTPFRICFNCHSAVMLPTHGELVLIAATNQPAVQAVAEAVGTPTVPGTPAQTPLSATLAWVGIPSDAWNAFNEELGGVTRVRDIVNISTTDWENAIPPTHPVRMCWATVRDASAIPCCGARGVRTARRVGTFRRYHHWLVSTTDDSVSVL